MSAQKQIERWLKSGKTLTPLQALNKFGNFRLAVIVNRLRQSGMDIVTLKIRNKGNDGFHAMYYKRTER